MTTRPVRSRTAVSGLRVYTLLLIAWLLLPIAVMILFGFNDTRGKQNFRWEGFTLRWYAHLLDKEREEWEAQGYAWRKR